MWHIWHLQEADWRPLGRRRKRSHRPVPSGPDLQVGEQCEEGAGGPLEMGKLTRSVASLAVDGRCEMCRSTRDKSGPRGRAGRRPRLRFQPLQANHPLNFLRASASAIRDVYLYIPHVRMTSGLVFNATTCAPHRVLPQAYHAGGLDVAKTADRRGSEVRDALPSPPPRCRPDAAPRRAAQPAGGEPATGWVGSVFNGEFAVPVRTCGALSSRSEQLVPFLLYRRVVDCSGRVARGIRSTRPRVRRRSRP